MTPEQFAAHVAHLAAAEWVRLGLEQPEQPVLRVVSIEDGPRFSVQIEANGEPPIPELRPVQRCALDAAPNFDQPAVTLKRLARDAGYGYNRHFRDAVADLVEKGLLVELRGLFRKPHPKSVP